MEILIALLAGLMMAIIIQLMLANLGLALGLSVINFAPSQHPSAHSTDSTDTADGPDGSTADASTALSSLPLTHLAGVGVAISVSSVLFVAALLATEFSQIIAPRRGIIFGLILWSAYWLLFVWLSSTTLSSVANSIVGTAIAGGRQLFNIIRQSLTTDTPDFAAIDEAMLRELVAEVSQVTAWQQQLPTLLAQQRETLIQEICDRTDLSTAEAETVVSGLESVPPPSPPTTQSATSSQGLLAQLARPNWQQIARQILTQVDLSDVNAETLWQQVMAFRDQPEPESQAHDPDVETISESEPADLAIPLDAEDFVVNAPRWSLQPAVLVAEFRDRIYDPEADPEQIEAQLATLNRDRYIDWLRQREDLETTQLETVADALAEVQADVLAALAPATPVPNPDTWRQLQEKLIAYCRYTNLDVLTPESLTEKLDTLYAELGLPDSAVGDTVQKDLAVLADVLARRRGMTAEQQEALAEVLTQRWTRPSSASPQLWQQAYQQLEHQLQAIDWQSVSLEDFKPDVLQQLQSLDATGQLDWAALSDRVAMPATVQADLQTWLHDHRRSLTKAPRRWLSRVSQSAQTWSQNLWQQVDHYLVGQEKSALQSQQIAADLADICRPLITALPNLSALTNGSDWPQIINLEAVQHSLERRRDMTANEIQQVSAWLNQAWDTVTQQITTLPATLWSEAQDLIQSEVANLDELRRQLVEQIVAGLETMQARAAAVKADLQKQIDRARQQVAIAAWWLLMSLVLSGGAAGYAGWLAVHC